MMNMQGSIIVRSAQKGLLASATFLVVGCTNMSGLGGGSEYACKAPEGVRCDSVSGNYHKALQKNLPGQRPKSHSAPTGDVAPSQSPARDLDTNRNMLRPAALRGTSVSADGSPPAAYAPLPLRSQSRILRLWFKPWEDVDHDLYDQGYVYVRVEDGRWLIDHAQKQIRDAYAPVRLPRSLTPASIESSNMQQAIHPSNDKPVEEVSSPLSQTLKSMQARAREPAPEVEK